MEHLFDDSYVAKKIIIRVSSLENMGKGLVFTGWPSPSNAPIQFVGSSVYGNYTHPQLIAKEVCVTLVPLMCFSKKGITGGFKIVLQESSNVGVCIR